MFPNGYNIPFYASYNMPRMAMGIGQIPRTGGLFSRLGGSIGTLRSFNWPSLLNNASKTLGVINQAIPVVKQIGPMYNNMKSMLKIASLFKDETDPTPRNNNTTPNNPTNNLEKENTITSNNYSNSPSFFI